MLSYWANDAVVRKTLGYLPQAFGLYPTVPAERFLEHFEIRYRLRSGSTWAYAGILFLVAIWMFLVTTDGTGLNNARERVAGGSVLPGMFGLLITAALCC